MHLAPQVITLAAKPLKYITDIYTDVKKMAAFNIRLYYKLIKDGLCSILLSRAPLTLRLDAEVADD